MFFSFIYSRQRSFSSTFYLSFSIRSHIYFFNTCDSFSLIFVTQLLSYYLCCIFLLLFCQKRTGQHLLPPSSFYLKFSFFNNLIFHFSFTVTSIIDYQIRQLFFSCVISPFLKHCLTPLIHQYTITAKHIGNTINCMDSGAQCSALLNKYVSIRC